MIARDRQKTSNKRSVQRSCDESVPTNGATAVDTGYRIDVGKRSTVCGKRHPIIARCSRASSAGLDVGKDIDALQIS